jgi:hypothetical protein
MARKAVSSNKNGPDNLNEIVATHFQDRYPEFSEVLCVGGSENYLAA